MAAKTGNISVSTKGRRDVVDLTSMVQEIITKNGVENGIAVVFVPGSTGAITTIEYEPGLKKDIDIYLEKIFPYSENYNHHNTWNDDNGAAHLQAALIGPSVSVPIVQGGLTLGTWQQIVLIDCDTRPRKRNIAVQLVY